MSEQVEMTEAKPGMDRRSILKKAAAAGAIVWTVPTITSKPALAATCTPKCAPTTPTPNATVTLYCSTSGDKQALLTITAAPSNCPCAGSQSFLCRNAPATWRKGNAANFAVSVCSTNPGLPVPIATNQIVIAKSQDLNGALGDGTFSNEQPLEVAVGCSDRNGDVSWISCTYNITFTFSPANGNCSTTQNVGTAIFTQTGTCTTTCGTSTCPFTQSSC